VHPSLFWVGTVISGSSVDQCSDLQSGIPQGMISRFFWVLLDLIIGFLVLIIKEFDNQTEIWS
jgi:hypothetical protein